MRKYKITVYVGLETHSKVIEAKNSVEANKKALDYNKGIDTALNVLQREYKRFNKRLEKENNS